MTTDPQVKRRGPWRQALRLAADRLEADAKQQRATVAAWRERLRDARPTKLIELAIVIATAEAIAGQLDALVESYRQESSW